MDDTTTDNQENADFSSSQNSQNTNCNSSSSNAKILADGSFVLNNSNNIDKKNGFNSDNNNGYKNSDTLNEEAMGNKQVMLLFISF